MAPLKTDALKNDTITRSNKQQIVDNTAEEHAEVLKDKNHATEVTNSNINPLRAYKHGIYGLL